MKKRIIALSLISIFSAGLLVGCNSSTEVEEKKPVMEDKAPEEKEEKDEPTQAELDAKLKVEAKQANFVEINGDNSKGKKVWAEGQISNVDSESFPIKFTLTQKESDGFGMYNITYLSMDKISLNEGDTVKIYGSVYEKDSTGMPTIAATVLEK